MYFLIERSNAVGVEVTTLITAGSVLFAGIVSPGLDTVAVLVIYPVLVVVAALTKIVPRVVPDGIFTLVVQENEFDAVFVLHVH